MMRKFYMQYDFKVLYKNIQPLGELHSELGVKAGQGYKKVGKVLNISKSFTMSTVTK